MYVAWPSSNLAVADARQIEFVRDKATKDPFPTSAAVSFRVQEAGMRPSNSISMYGATGTVDGIRGDHILLAPPYNVSREEIDIIVDTAIRVIRDVLASLPATIGG